MLAIGFILAHVVYPQRIIDQASERCVNILAFERRVDLPSVGLPSCCGCEPCCLRVTESVFRVPASDKIGLVSSVTTSLFSSVQAGHSGWLRVCPKCIAKLRSYSQPLLNILLKERFI